MQGQPSLTNFIQKITFDTLPRSLILSGPTGCGKKLFISELSQKLNLDLNYLSEINLDILDTIQSRAIPMLYIIPDDLLTTKNQNTLLKFIEEPNPLAFYIIVTSKLNSIIETIRNRCQILVFENYSKDILKQFLIDEDESILNFVTTPGDIIELRKIDFKFLCEYCNKILTLIDKANHSNVLSISSKIDWDLKDTNSTKYPYHLFLRCLLITIADYIKNNSNCSKNIFEVFHLTQKVIVDINTANYNKDYLFQEYLLTIRSILKE